MRIQSFALLSVAASGNPSQWITAWRGVKQTRGANMSCSRFVSTMHLGYGERRNACRTLSAVLQLALPNTAIKYWKASQILKCKTPFLESKWQLSDQFRVAMHCRLMSPFSNGTPFSDEYPALQRSRACVRCASCAAVLRPNVPAVASFACHLPLRAVGGVGGPNPAPCKGDSRFPPRHTGFYAKY